MTNRPAGPPSATVYSCIGKEAFRSPQLAAAVNKRRTKGGKPNDVYRCSFCGGWHLGNRPKNVGPKP